MVLVSRGQKPGARQRTFGAALALSVLLVAYCWFFARLHAFWLEAFALSLFLWVVATVWGVWRVSLRLRGWHRILLGIGISMLICVLVIVLGACVFVAAFVEAPSTLGRWMVSDGRVVSVRTHHRFEIEDTLEIEGSGAFARAPRAVNGRPKSNGSVSSEIVYELPDVSPGCRVTTIESGGSSVWTISEVAFSDACKAKPLGRFGRSY